MKNCFLNTGGVNIGGRKIKCIRFADNMALIAEDERMLKNMLMSRCKDYGMKNNITRRRPWLSGGKQRRSTCELKMNPSNKWTASNTKDAIL